MNKNSIQSILLISLILAATGCITHKPVAMNESEIKATCFPDWECTEWSGCDEQHVKTRTCNDANECGTEEGKPKEIENCDYAEINKDNITVSDIRYLIVSVELLDSLSNVYVENSPIPKTIYPEGVFIDIQLNAENIGREAKNITPSKFELIDNSSISYAIETNNKGSSLRRQFEFGELKPGFARKGHIQFDVPDYHKQYKLFITGDSEKSGKYISIADLNKSIKCGYADMKINVEVEHGNDIYLLLSINNTGYVNLKDFDISFNYTQVPAHFGIAKNIQWTDYSTIGSGQSAILKYMLVSDLIDDVSITSIECPEISRQWRNE